MAIINKKILGSPAGKVGDVVFKNNRGTIYSSSKPAKYKKTKSVPLIKNRKTFTQRAGFCKFLIKSKLIKNIWNYSDLPGFYPYHRIFKYNYKYITINDISDQASILPENFSIRFSNFYISDNSFSYDFLPSQQFIEKMNGTLVFVAFLYMNTPVDTGSEKKDCMILLVKEAPGYIIVPDQYNHFEFSYDDSPFSVVNNFQKVMAFPAIISINEGNKYEWCSGKCEYIKGTKPQPAPEAPQQNTQTKTPYNSIIIK
ncbi:MAG: hypothetical protein WC644_01620 [Ignavibacteria bacterium]